MLLDLLHLHIWSLVRVLALALTLGVLGWQQLLLTALKSELGCSSLGWSRLLEVEILKCACWIRLALSKR